MQDNKQNQKANKMNIKFQGRTFALNHDGINLAASAIVERIADGAKLGTIWINGRIYNADRLFRDIAEENLFCVLGTIHGKI